MITQSEITLLLLGASISLVSSIAVFIMQSLYKNSVNKRGKIKIYKKLVYSKVNQKSWGYWNNNFSVPLWVEIQNTRNQNEVIRNINLVLYKNNKEISLMTQINTISTEGKIHPLANKGSYSIILKPNSIERLDLYFTIKKVEKNNSFDEVRLRYYNTEDQMIEYPLLKVSNPWTYKDNKIDEDWTLLK